MRWITASLVVALSAGLLMACASAPPPKPAGGYWITDPHYWDRTTVSMNKALRASILAGKDPEATYRSLMNMRCAQRQRIADPQQHAAADADCAAVAAMPPSTPATTH
jgi:hypothetical protein